MEAVGQLTGGIAHDFNNLMAVIMGNLEEASERSRNNPDTVAYIDAAIATVERGASLTQQLLSFSRRQALNPRIEPLRSLLSDFQKLFHRTIGEDIRLDVQLPDDEIVVEIDRAMFGNTILNLALNARDSMPNGGNLTISAAPCVLDGKIFQESGPISGRFVRISVSDTGTGITAQNLGRVFEPFFTTKDVGEGSGLGLSMAYGFINQSNGHIEIRSKIGEGTTVSLYLPVAEPRSESEGQDAARAPDAGMDTIPGKTVLVVEDDSLVRQTTTATLKSLGYVVIEASSGPTARKILEENAESIDIVFSDVIMPDGMTGLDLAREIQSRHPHVRILLTSGYAESRLSRSDHDYISDAGIHILPKPFRRSALTKALSMLSVA
jgi:CheY-like chemotaxis protein